MATAFLELEGDFMSNLGDRKFMKSSHCANCNFYKFFFQFEGRVGNAVSFSKKKKNPGL